MSDIDYIREKNIAILESVTNTATQMTKAAKEIPKKNIYFFKRKNIRGLSRQNKKKRSKAIFALHFAAFVGAVNISRIKSTPIPKFPKGTR